MKVLVEEEPQVFAEVFRIGADVDRDPVVKLIVHNMHGIVVLAGRSGDTSDRVALQDRVTFRLGAFRNLLPVETVGEHNIRPMTACRV